MNKKIYEYFYIKKVCFPSIKTQVFIHRSEDFSGNINNKKSSA